jgi:suppressor of tumorigenicity protein 13
MDPFASSEIDQDGVIEPDTDEPQEMGDLENLEVRIFILLKTSVINIT